MWKYFNGIPAGMQPRALHRYPDVTSLNLRVTQDDITQKFIDLFIDLF